MSRRARGLTADAKQKISLGRGLVRSDVAAVLFDEPLTVIDPALKWQLRSKLKAVHRALDLLMIYVTHDQIEALTFADKVVVMKDGRVVQIGTPARAVRAAGAHVRRLFHRLARHEFRAGGGRGPRRPGRRPADRAGDGAIRSSPAGATVQSACGPNSPVSSPTAAAFRCRSTHRRSRAAPAGPRGARRRTKSSPPCRTDVSIAGEQASAWRSGSIGCSSTSTTSCVHGRAAMMDKPINNRAWFLVAAGAWLVLFSALLPMMTVVNYSVQDTHGQNQFLLERRRLVPRSARTRRRRSAPASPTRLLRNLAFSLVALLIEVPLGIAIALCAAARRAGRSAPAGDHRAADADSLERGRHDLADFHARRTSACSAPR